MPKYLVEYTDTFGGEANYSWLRQAIIIMPELDHYGYDGSSGYAKANRVYQRELMRRAKAAVGLTGVKGETHDRRASYEFRPRRSNTVMFVTWIDD